MDARDEVSITAAAQGPKREWRRNADGCTRSIDEARDLVAKVRAPPPSWVRVVVDRHALLADGVYAQYGAFASTRNYTWDDLFVPPRNADDEPAIVIKLRASVLESDEAIVAVLSHELFEIEGLEAAFEQEPTMSGEKLIQRIGPDRPNNLHCQAWGEADAMVDKMRKDAEEPSDGD